MCAFSPVHVVFFIAFLCNSFPTFRILLTFLPVCLGSASSHIASHHCLAQLQGLGFPGSQHFCSLGHSLIFALSNSMKRLLSSREHPETILLNTLFNTFLFSCYTEVSSEWVLKRKNKTCGLVEFTMKPDSIAIETIDGHHFLILNISY